MSDKDDIRPRGIPFFSVVDELGVSTDGQSASMSLIRSRGMQPICEVNSSGVATSGSTLTALRARGIRFYCPVTENGVTADAVSMATLRARGIPFFCPVGTDGIATGGTATMRELAARGIPYVCLLDSLGGAGDSPPAPNTLVAGAGSFVLSGEAMTPLVDFSLPAAVGAFTLTGQDATLTYDGGGAFTPAFLSPNWWVEPGQGGLFQSNAGTTAASANSDVVGYCPDLSGNTFTLTSVADDTTRPTLQGVGSFPYLSFDGSNDLLRRTAALDGWNAGAATWAFTFRSNSNATNSFLAAVRNSASTSAIYSLIKADNGTATTASMLVRDDSVVNVTGFTAANANVFNGSDHVLIVVDTGSSVQVYLDGVQITGVASYTHTQTLTLNRFAIGGSLSVSAGNWWAGRIYGGVVLNRAIDATERANLTTYMGNLAGLSL